MSVLDDLESEWLPWKYAAAVTNEPEAWVQEIVVRRRVPIRTAGRGTTNYVRPTDIRTYRAANRKTRRLTPLSETTLIMPKSGPLADADDAA
jgi:hypothetical protein